MRRMFTCVGVLASGSVMLCPALARAQATKPPEQAPPAEAAPKQAATQDAKNDKKIATMAPSERIKAVRKRYADAKTYRDEGVCANTIRVGIDLVTACPFSTAFERDGRLTWRFQNPGGTGTGPGWRYVVWSSDQKSASSWWTLRDKTQQFDSLEMAFAGPTGISNGNAVTIIPLLRGERSVFAGTEGELGDGGVEALDGVECAVIESRTSEVLTTKLWIDADFVIRKIENTMTTNTELLRKLDPKTPQVPPTQSKTVMTFKPVFDEKIADEVFKVDPQKPGEWAEDGR